VRAQLDDPASARIIHMLTHLVFSILDAFGQSDEAPGFLYPRQPQRVALQRSAALSSDVRELCRLSETWRMLRMRPAVDA